ncbi:MAG: DUF3305 domain-containing protein [Beijerinckiaceae bacterium]
MAAFTLSVGVVLTRRPSTSPWQDVVWEAHAVLPDVPAAEAGVRLGRDGDAEMFYAGAHEIAVHPQETEHYRSNLMAEPPRLWVVLRPTGGPELPEVVRVTCDPSEGEGFAETGWDVVNVVDMPEAIQLALMTFVDEHHVEKPFYKRKRRDANPEALAFGRRGPERDRMLRERGLKDDDHEPA